MPTGLIDNLDNEVREDVEIAAELHAKASGVPLLPAAGDSVEPSALPPAPPLTLEAFLALMEQALLLRRGPRAYLVPSPSSKHNPEPTFRPAINAHSRDLAARLRPAELQTFEILHHTADASRAKLEELRRLNEEAALKGCTFAPSLNQASLAAEGRALRAAACASGSTTPRSGRPSPAVQAAQQEEQDEFLLLEKEVQEALAGASLTAAQLEGIRVAGGAAELAEVLRQRQGVDPNEVLRTEEMLLDLLASEGSLSEQPGAKPPRANAAGASKLEDLAGKLKGWDHNADPMGATLGAKSQLRT